MAQQYFQLLGASASECDTIPGRQCMASCFFILRQFDDVLVYLSSIEVRCSSPVAQCRDHPRSVHRARRPTPRPQALSRAVPHPRHGGQAYYPNDPTFLYNYAVARAAAGKYKEAEPALLALQSGGSAEELARDYIFQMWLARCLVMNGKARHAWEVR